MHPKLILTLLTSAVLIGCDSLDNTPPIPEKSKQSIELSEARATEIAKRNKEVQLRNETLMGLVENFNIRVDRYSNENKDNNTAIASFVALFRDVKKIDNNDPQEFVDVLSSAPLWTEIVDQTNIPGDYANAKEEFEHNASLQDKKALMNSTLKKVCHAKIDQEDSFKRHSDLRNILRGLLAILRSSKHEDIDFLSVYNELGLSTRNGNPIDSVIKNYGHMNSFVFTNPALTQDVVAKQIVKRLGKAVDDYKKAQKEGKDDATMLAKAKLKFVLGDTIEVVRMALEDHEDDYLTKLRDDAVAAKLATQKALSETQKLRDQVSEDKKAVNKAKESIDKTYDFIAALEEEVYGWAIEAKVAEFGALAAKTQAKKLATKAQASADKALEHASYANSQARAACTHADQAFEHHQGAITQFEEALKKLGEATDTQTAAGQQLASARAEHAKALATHNEINKRLGNWEPKLAESIASVKKALAAQKKSNENVVATQQAALEAKNSVIASTKMITQVFELQKKMVKTQEDISEKAGNILQEVSHFTNVAKPTIDDLKGEVKTHQDKIGELEKTKQALKIEEARLTGELAAKNAQISEQIKKIEAFEKDLQEANTQKTQAEGKIKELEKSLKKSQSDLEAKQEELKNSQTSLDNVTNERDRVMVQRDEAQDKVTIKNAELEQAKEKLREANAALEREKGDKTKAQQDAKEANETVEEVRDELTEATQKLLDLEVRVNELMDVAKKQTERAKTAESEVGKLKKQIDEMEKEKESAQKDKSNAEKEIKKLNTRDESNTGNPEEKPE